MAVPTPCAFPCDAASPDNPTPPYLWSVKARNLLLFLLFGFMVQVKAQTASPYFIGTSGKVFSNIQGSLSFSVGEMAITTLRTGNGPLLTQGFQQVEIPIDTVCKFLVPDAFTPGPSPGLNDFFRPLSACQPELYELEIYNRWGKAIFRTVNPNEGWDGKENGEAAPVGTYLWRLSYRFGRIGGVAKMRGEINLLR